MSLHAVLAYGSILLACMQLASNWLLKNRRQAGWAIVLAITVLGLWYDWRTAQYGYIGLAFFNIPVAILAWRKWGREGDPEALHRKVERAESALSDALLRLAHGDAELHARLLADAGYEGLPGGGGRETEGSPS